MKKLVVLIISFLAVSIIQGTILSRAYSDSENYSSDIQSDKPYEVEWWYVQHRTYENGTDRNVSHFGIKDLADNYVLENVIATIELFDPDGNSVSLTDNSGYGSRYKDLYGSYNADMGQWQYDDGFSKESWYRVEFTEPLKQGTYYLKLTDIYGNVYDLYKYFSGLILDLPLIASDSFYAYIDENGNFHCTWKIPDPLVSYPYSTSVRAWVTAMGDGADLDDAEIYVKVPTHLENLFIPNEVFQKLQSTGNGFKFGLHLRTNDGTNRVYSETIEIDPLKLPPQKGDLNGDGDVDGSDLEIFSNNFATSP